MNIPEFHKLVGASLLFVAAIVNTSQISPARDVTKDTSYKSVPGALKEAVPELKKLELREQEQNKKLDSLATVVDSVSIKQDNTIGELKQSIETKNVIEVTLDETNIIQQSVIENKIPLLLRRLNVSMPVKFRVRMVEPVAEYRTDPKPVALPEVVTPCPEKNGILRRLFKHKK